MASKVVEELAPPIHDGLDVDYETDDDDCYGEQYFRSIRSTTGLEIGLEVAWPGIVPITLDTCLQEGAISPMFSGTQWAGTRVWRAAVTALEYLLDDDCPFRLSADTSVVELGCGLGVPGMVLHAINGCPVVVTDLDDLVSQLGANLAKAFPQSSSIQGLALDWSAKGVDELLSATGRSGFDLVLCCDCIFEPLYSDSWKQLLECQIALLQANPSSIVLTSVERRRYDGIEKYLAAAEESPSIRKVERIVPTRAHPPSVELYRFHGSDHK